MCPRVSPIGNDGVGSNRPGDVFKLLVAKIDKVFLEFVAYLFISGAGKTNTIWVCDTLKTSGDIDAITHKITVTLLDNVAEMDADAKLDAALRWQAGVALDHAVLYLDGAAHGVNHAAELYETSVAGTLHHAPVMHGDGRIDQIAAERPKPCQRAILVGAGEQTVSDHIGRQDC